MSNKANTKKRRFTSKQLNIILVLTSIAIAVIGTIISVKVPEILPNKLGLILSFLTIIVTIIIGSIYSFAFIFKLLGPRENEEKRKKVIEHIENILSKDEFKEISICEAKTEVEDLFMQMLEHNKYGILAKLNDNESVTVVIKNSEGETLYSEVYGIAYFYDSFKFQLVN